MAGGLGTRLHPVTLAISKQLVPVYNKPMIYYPLSVLMLAGIRDICVITTPHEQAGFKALLRDGSQWGIHITYVPQPHPGGLAQAFHVGEDFVGKDPCCLILGDNIFYGHGLQEMLLRSVQLTHGATVFAYHVEDAREYGVVSFGADGKAETLEEKPAVPKSNYAVTGLYCYDGRVVELSKTLKPSPRGQLEITDLNRLYLEEGTLTVELLGRGYAWLDTGNHDNLLQAGQFVQAVEHRQGFLISSPEEIAYRNGWMSKEQLCEIGKALAHNSYGRSLLRLAADDA